VKYNLRVLNVIFYAGMAIKDDYAEAVMRRKAITTVAEASAKRRADKTIIRISRWQECD